MRACPSFLSFYDKDLWPSKIEPRSPNSQLLQQATSNQNCYCTRLSTFQLVAWPTDHCSHKPVSPLIPKQLQVEPFLNYKCLDQSHQCGKLRPQRLYKKSQCDSKWKTYSGFSLCSLISTADSCPGESWHMHSTFVYEITCLFCSSSCYSCFSPPHLILVSRSCSPKTF